MSHSAVKLTPAKESPRGLYAVISSLLLIGGIEPNPGPAFETRCELCAALHGSLVEQVEMRELQLTEGKRKVEELERNLQERENNLKMWEEVLKERETLIEQREVAFEKKVKEVEKACKERVQKVEKACKDSEKIAEQRELMCKKREELSRQRERELRDREEGPHWQELLSQYNPGHWILQQTLNWAAEVGYINVVNFLLARNPCVDWKRTALNHAAERGQLDVVKTLIEEEKIQGREDCLSFGKCDIDVNIGIHIRGLPALLLSAKEGHLEVVRYLVEEGGRSGEVMSSALIPAAQWGHLNIVRYLTTLDNTCLNVKTSDGFTPLHLAIREGHLEVVRYLSSLDHTSLNVKTKGGFTALHLAIREGRLEVVRYLTSLDHTSLNVKTCDGFTPLHLAIKECHLEVVKHLTSLDHTSLNIKTRDGFTPLHLAIREGHLEVVKYLTTLDHTSLNVKTAGGYTPLHWAAHYGHLEIVKHITSLDHTSLNMKTSATFTPLHLAAQCGHLEVVKHLTALDHTGLKVKTSDGSTPLHWAAQCGHLEVVKHLTARDPTSLKVKTSYGYIALHFAARWGHLEVVKHLTSLDHTSLNVKTSYGDTPLDLAKQCGLLEVVHFLEQCLLNNEEEDISLEESDDGEEDAVILSEHDTETKEEDVENEADVPDETGQNASERFYTVPGAEEFTAPYRCTGLHSPRHRNCPTNLSEKKIQEIKTLDGLSYQEARREFNSTNKPASTLDCSMIAQSPPGSSFTTSMPVVIAAPKATVAPESKVAKRYLITQDGSRPLPEKVQAIKDYKLPETVRDLRTFLGLINFYRRYLPNAAETQAILHEYLKGAKKNDSRKIDWTDEAKKQFEKCKEDLINATFLTFPVPDLPIALFTDASDQAVGAALQQYEDAGWKPIAFYSKKLSSAQKNYSAYDKELLAIYLAVKQFRHLIEGRELTIFTDHKPITYAFQQKNEKASPRQLRHLQYISQFTTDIRHVSGRDNVVADTLSRLHEISVIDYEVIAKHQENDEELKQLRQDNTSLKFKQCQLGSQYMLWCDVSTNNIRPFVPKLFRTKSFRQIHDMAHPGVKATVKNVVAKFIWPGIRNDVRKWAQSCISCQQNKVTRHTKSPVGNFEQPDDRFKVVHIGIIGPLPPSEGNIYCLTCIDRFSSWMEIIPMANITSQSVASSFYNNWISRFGVPEVIVTDQGKQFESELFRDLTKLCGVKVQHTTSYHPQANGKLERLHRTLKAAIRAHKYPRWTQSLPTVLLSLRAAIREDSNYSLAEMAYGTTIRLPGVFFEHSVQLQCNPDTFVTQLRDHIKHLKPAKPRTVTSRSTFIHKDLSCTFYPITGPILRMSHSAAKLLPAKESSRGLYTIISVLLLIGGIEPNPGPVFETRCELCAAVYESLGEHVEMRELQPTEDTRVVEELERSLKERENNLKMWEKVLEEREMVIEQREETFEKKVKEVNRAFKDREKIVEQRELTCEKREELSRQREREWRGRGEGPRWRELLSQYNPGHVILQQTLNWAAEEGYINVMNFLLARNPCIAWKRTALNHAAERGQLHVVRALVEEEKNQCREDCLSFGRCYIDVNIGTHIRGLPALLLSAKEGNMEVVRYLLEKGSMSGELMCSALVSAAQWGHLELVRNLVEGGGISGDVLGSALIPAAQWGQLDIVRYLTTLHHTSLNVKTSAGYTPLHLAIREGHLEVVKHLTTVDLTSLNVKTCDGRTPLHWAAQWGHLEVVKHLTTLDLTSPKVKTRYGDTPLHLAAWEGHLEVVKHLTTLDHTSLNVKTCDGYTPLHWAARYGHLEVVKHLATLDHNSLNVKTGGGYTPLDVAKRWNHRKVIHFLEQCSLNR
ncbi:uncharacterized protein [Anabrus simplex]|uniref:uncharacterized protein n=1 Tax=Anabrus simplex TaxID=316456 RepID=UPI0035A3AF8A